MSTELEQFADSKVQETFKRLYLNDVFLLLTLFKENTPAYNAFLWNLIDAWTIPDEDRADIQDQIDKYAPRAREE